MADAIIALARGINPDGSLPADPRSRVRKAVELYKAGVARHIVMSGASSFHLDKTPHITEASAMKNYAIKLGVKSGDVLEEAYSRDTIGNVYFTKTEICEPNSWQEIAVVASEEHMARVQYLFKKIYGSRYRIVYEASDRVIDDNKYKAELRHEKESLLATKKALDHVKDGDDKTVEDLMRANHPAYSSGGD